MAMATANKVATAREKTSIFDCSDFTVGGHSQVDGVTLFVGERLSGRCSRISCHDLSAGGLPDASRRKSSESRLRASALWPVLATAVAVDLPQKPAKCIARIPLGELTEDARSAGADNARSSSLKLKQER